jgi:hypothetical protein
MPKIFKRKKWYQKELKTARKDVTEFFSLRVVQIFFIVAIPIIAVPFLVFYIHRPKPQNDINYGITYSWKYADEMGLDWKDTYIKILDDLGAKNLRLVTYWEDVEATRDNYDYSNIKWQLDEAEKRDASVILSFGRKVPRYPECFEPSWWNEIPNEDVRNHELYEYVKTTVGELKHYKTIKLWQVENEPFWPFGECVHEFEFDTVRSEIELVRSLDDREILVQDSGEGGLWYKTYILGDYLGISMYRKIWYDFWGIFFNNFIYFKYPLAHWTYAIKAGVVQVPYQKIIVTELQGEPWGPGINSELTEEDKNSTMSRADFLATLSYAQKAGFKDLYLWGAEWWLWEKEMNDNPYFWDTAKPLFN